MGKCRLTHFGKQYLKGYGGGSYAEAKLQRLGNVSLIVSNCDPFFRKYPPDGGQAIRDAHSLSKGTGGQASRYFGKESVDLQRLRRQAAFDRLLARLFQAAQPRALPWILKGGYAMELRIKAARTTKDIDLTMRNVFSSGEKKDDTKNLAVLEKLQEAAAFNSEDFFV